MCGFHCLINHIVSVSNFSFPVKHPTWFTFLMKTQTLLRYALLSDVLYLHGMDGFWIVA